MAMMIGVCLLLVWLGGAVLSASVSGRRFQGLHFLAYSVALGVMALAVLGVLVVSLPTPYMWNARIGLAAVVLLPAWSWVRHRLWLQLGSGGWRRVLIVAAAWYGLAAAALFATSLPVHLSQPLPDGAYVIKNDHLHVRLQAAMGDFPADNYIPFVVGEFLLRDIQFANERPLMPGQELSNRPILMSLVYLPFRAALDPPPRQTAELSRFQYVGQSWPDGGQFGDDSSFRGFLCIALVLNATILLGAALLLERAGITGLALPLALLVMISSPYFLGQTLFTWPKSLAAFFVLVAGVAMLEGHRSWVVGLLLGLAYWAHPYALAFGLGFIGLLLWRERNDPVLRRGLLPFAATLFACVLLWWLWSQWYLQIPTDLVSQNVGSASAMDAVLARLVNLRNSFLPWDGSVPSAAQVAQMAILGLVGATGIVWLPMALAGGWESLRRWPLATALLLALPSACLIGVFGMATLPAMHGLQPVAVVLWVLSLWWGRRRLPRPVFLVLLLAQLAINLILLSIHASAMAGAA